MTAVSASSQSGSESTSSPSMSNSTATGGRSPPDSPCSSFRGDPTPRTPLGRDCPSPQAPLGPLRGRSGEPYDLDTEVLRLGVVDDDGVGRLLGVQLHLFGQLDADPGR